MPILLGLLVITGMKSCCTLSDDGIYLPRLERIESTKAGGTSVSKCGIAITSGSMQR
jgi:hypothetical protein